MRTTRNTKKFKVRRLLVSIFMIICCFLIIVSFLKLMILAADTENNHTLEGGRWICILFFSTILAFTSKQIFSSLSMYFSMVKESIKNRGKFFAWFTLICWTISLISLPLLIYLLCLNLYLMDEANRYGIAYPTIPVLIIIGILAIMTPFYIFSWDLKKVWRNSSVISCIIEKNTHKNEDQ